MRIKQSIADFIYKHISFTNACKPSGEFSWMLKNNCPYCINKPIENLSNYEYHEKYPVKNKIVLGSTIVTVYLCDYHLKELKKKVLSI